MWTFKIVFTPNAKEDLEQITAWYAANAPEQLREWILSIRAEIETLSTMPERCPHAPENGLWSKMELRQLLFSQFTSQYRIIFTVQDNQVKILTIRHDSRRYLYEERN